MASYYTSRSQASSSSGRNVPRESDGWIKKVLTYLEGLANTGFWEFHVTDVEVKILPDYSNNKNATNFFLLKSKAIDTNLIDERTGKTRQVQLKRLGKTYVLEKINQLVKDHGLTKGSVIYLRAKNKQLYFTC